MKGHFEKNKVYLLKRNDRDFEDRKFNFARHLQTSLFMNKEVSKKVGLQGTRASLHYLAAEEFFKENMVEILEFPSAKAACTSLKSKKTDYAVLAIENTIAGTVLPNYSLLENFLLRIVGEINLRVELHLMALPGQKIGDIRAIQSHPMAIYQCMHFLNSLQDVQLIEASDTATSAKMIAEKQLPVFATIANSKAAEIYGLEILAENIESNSYNFTRFLILADQDHPPIEEANKCSLRFKLEDKKGKLFQVLGVLDASNVNMTKIQSVPVTGKPYEYSFHVDLEWEDKGLYEKALEQIKSLVIEMIHFGEYRRGNKPLI